MSAHMAYRARQGIRDRLSDLVAFALQRLPFLTHFFVIFLAALGPLLAPTTLSLALLFVHCGFFLCQARSAYGVFQCWRGVKAHSARDWKEWYLEQRIEREAQGKAQHVLPIEEVEHVILLPAYKEDVDTLKEALNVLASHHLASRSYRVCLCMEERESGSPRKAQSLVDLYRSMNAFRDITFSLHPSTIVGESAGKSSNINWGARHMANMQPQNHSRQVITVMDADTAFASDAYLAISAQFALASPELRTRMMFVPPTLFDRNSADVPIFTRAADIFWSCAGIGGIYPSSSCKIPTSAYFVSMELAKFCDFWDAGPQAIGEDLHFYCKAMFETKGHVHAVSLYSPASQVNVVGDTGRGVVTNYLLDMKARWTQAVRHLWGSLDFGYCWHRVLTGRIGRSHPQPGYMAIDANDANDSPAGSPTYGHVEMVQLSNAARKVPVQVIHSTSPEETPRYPSPAGTVATESTLVDEPAALRKSLADMREGLNLRKSFERGSSESTATDVELCVEQPLGEESIDDEETYFSIDQRRRVRLFPLVVLLTRLWEAHLMIAHVFLFGLIVMTIYPVIVYRNGSVEYIHPFSGTCTVEKCLAAIFSSTPFSAGADIPRDADPGLQPSWIMPDIVQCSIAGARLLGGLGIVSTVVMCAMHDFYHHAATYLRWRDSDAVLREWQRGGCLGERPARYLGVRPAAQFRRRWPVALLDFLAIPAGLFYGVAPLLWAQLNHIVTNKLTYTVSAKNKTVVMLSGPVDERSVEAVRRSLDVSRMSLDVHRRKEGSRISVDASSQAQWRTPAASAERRAPRPSLQLPPHPQRQPLVTSA